MTEKQNCNQIELFLIFVGLKKYSDNVEKYIVRIFEKPGFVRKLIIIEKSGKVFYYSK